MIIRIDETGGTPPALKTLTLTGPAPALDMEFKPNAIADEL
jgi:hypothetical protein